MEKIKINNQTLEYTIIRSNRKTLGLEIRPEKGLLIRAPKRISQQKIQEVIIKKSSWIIKKLEEVKEIKPEPKPLEFITGEEILYLGEYYKIKIKEEKNCLRPKVLFKFDCFLIIVDYNIKNEERRQIIRNALVVWYKNHAGLVINKRINIFKDRIGVEPALVRIKKQRKRWGSCSSMGNINFNWKLIMAPMSVLDYLVVHELAHLVHPNHSKEYWNLVELIISDYQDRQDWLKINGNLLTI